MDRNAISAWGALAGLLLALTVAAAATAGLRPNPANDPRLLSKPIEGFQYDQGRRCKSGTPRGTRALVRWMETNVRGESWGIKRCERLSGSSYSLHSESRALDWHLDVANRKERRAANRLIRTLLASDKRGNDAALARRMGVQGMIYDCRAWWSSPGGMERYSYCYRSNGKRRRGLDRTQAHMDHIHIELNKRGAAKRTSFWRSPLAR